MTYGDEVCDILTKDLEMPDVPNDVFPEGVQVRDPALKINYFICFSLASTTTIVRMMTGRTQLRGLRSLSVARLTFFLNLNFGLGAVH